MLFMNLIGVVSVFTAALLWASDAPFRLMLTQELSSTFIVFAEHALSLVVAIPLLYVYRKHIAQLSLKQWVSIVFIGVCGSALASVAFTQAFHYMNPSVAIVLQKLQPILVIALSSGFLAESLHPRFITGATLALIGGYIISFPTLIPHVYDGEVFNPTFVGVTLALAAVVFWAVSTVLGKAILRTVPFLAVTSLRFVVAFLFLLCLVSLSGSFPPPAALTPTVMWALVLIACVSGIGSLALYYYGLRTTPASVATVAELGFPIAAVLVNWIFIPGSALVFAQVIGMVMVIGSIAYISIRR